MKHIPLNDLSAMATLLLPLIDLTNLSDDATDQIILQLCKQAQTAHGNVAAICVYPRFVELAKQILPQPINIATVVNFPTGNETKEKMLNDTQQAIANGANEIDIVLPYQAYLAGDSNYAIDYVRACKQACGQHAKLKVILETGELKKPDIIEQASLDMITAGADFLKTSTGKVGTNATLEAAEAMLNVIRATKPTVGLKISGGISTVKQASDYVKLVAEMMSPDWICAEQLRFGASRLLDDILALL